MWTNHLHVNSLSPQETSYGVRSDLPTLCQMSDQKLPPCDQMKEKNHSKKKKTLFQTEKEKERCQKFTKVATGHLKSSGKTGRCSQKRSQDEHSSLEGRWETGKSSRKFNTSLNKGKHKNPQTQQMLLSGPSTHSLQPTGSCSTTSSSLSCPPPHPLVFPLFLFNRY